MAVTFSGEFTSPRSPNEVYDFLCDPNKFGPLLPDFESMSVQDATHFTVKVRVGVGNIRGSADIKMELAESVRPTRAQYKGRGNAVGSQITIVAGFDLSPVDSSTRIAWQGEASVFGKLASMAGGMLEPLGKKNIQKLIDGLQWALTQPPEQVVAKEAGGMEVQNAVAEQTPIPSAEELHSDRSQSPAAEEPATDEFAGTRPPNTAAQQLPRPAADSTADDLDNSRVSRAMEEEL